MWCDVRVSGAIVRFMGTCTARDLHDRRQALAAENARIRRQAAEHIGRSRSMIARCEVFMEWLGLVLVSGLMRDIDADQ